MGAWSWPHTPVVEYEWSESWGGHQWVETGTQLIFCKRCNQDGKYESDGSIAAVRK
jgi:hypothetical protein